MVTEDDATAVRDTFEKEGELSAVIELRRRFLGITDNEKTRLCVRSIVGWKPQAAPVSTVTRLRPRKR